MSFFFNSWANIGRVIVVGTLSYIALVALVRITGKRSLAKLNSYDLVVTVALGSTLATILLNREVSLMEGLTAFGLLLGIQFIGAWLSVRSDAVQSMLTAEPTLVFFEGRFLRGAMKKERVTEEHILTAIRKQGAASTQKVHAVIVETSGDLSCILSGGKTQASVENAMPGQGPRVA